MKKKIFLTIGGSDPSGGAGIQADIRVADRLGLYPLSVISAVTSQNTSTFADIFPVPVKVLRTQLETLLSDITPDCVKIGMLPSPEHAECVADTLREYVITSIVVDPLLVPTLSHQHASKKLVAAVARHLFSIATLVTPNLEELEVYEAVLDQNFDRLCNAYLLKGGHGKDDTITDTLYLHDEAPAAETGDVEELPDYMYNSPSPFPTVEMHPMSKVRETNEQIMFGSPLTIREFKHDRIDTGNTHGSGCVLSSAIACYLALDSDLVAAVEKALTFINDALAASKDFKLGKGNYGPSLL
ncbi:MAG: hydroxymethylpyrimidine/phosphomethylpyrimidine kinase [Muribaculaceae bacterium]|nr:hydroxymethylpyrimidine/phosphomethylpyrimidine kinase [Muribaculaceae bacterium]